MEHMNNRPDIDKEKLARSLFTLAVLAATDGGDANLAAAKAASASLAHTLFGPEAALGSEAECALRRLLRLPCPHTLRLPVVGVDRSIHIDFHGDKVPVNLYVVDAGVAHEIEVSDAMYEVVVEDLSAADIAAQAVQVPGWVWSDEGDCDGSDGSIGFDFIMPAHLDVEPADLDLEEALAWLDAHTDEGSHDLREESSLGCADDDDAQEEFADACRDKVLEVLEEVRDSWQELNYPMMNYYWPLSCDPSSQEAERIAAETALVAIRLTETDNLALALAGGGMDLSWDIAYAYILAGSLPPVDLRLPDFAGLDLGRRERTIIAALDRAHRVLQQRSKSEQQILQQLVARMGQEDNH